MGKALAKFNSVNYDKWKPKDAEGNEEWSDFHVTKKEMLAIHLYLLNNLSHFSQIIGDYQMKIAKTQREIEQLQIKEDMKTLQSVKIVAMTTTGAAKYKKLL